MEDPYEFDKDWNMNKIRKAAKDYAIKQGADLLIEINDPNYSSNRHNDLVYYIFGKGNNPQMNHPGAQQKTFPQSQYSGMPQQQKPQPPLPQRTMSTENNRGQALYLKSHYSNHEEVIVDCLSNLSKMLCMDPIPIQFMDNKEFIGISVVLGQSAYNHMGSRRMDVVLVNIEPSRYKILGNETHDPYARRVQYMRDELVVIKTDGIPRFDFLPDYSKLDADQKSNFATSLYSFMEMFLPKM